MEPVNDFFAVDSAAEVTMEINPGSVIAEKLVAFKNSGVNRASFGAQTFDDSELAKLGRSHTSADTMKTFEMLRTAGFTNINFDLIAGLPGQTMSGWQRNVELAFALKSCRNICLFYLFGS